MDHERLMLASLFVSSEDNSACMDQVRIQVQVRLRPVAHVRRSL